MAITTYIPKEFFFNELGIMQLSIAIIIILAILIFLGYEFSKLSKIKRKPESF
jgi:flagellar biogenesis protein FliO